MPPLINIHIVIITILILNDDPHPRINSVFYDLEARYRNPEPDRFYGRRASFKEGTVLKMHPNA